MSEFTEQDDLLPRVATGDRGAASACIRHYQGLVWSLARRFIANEADAEEAVQEIFMHLWREAGRYDPVRGSEATFVSMLARRRLIDLRRRQGREPIRVALDETVPQLSSDGQQAMERSTDARRVRDFLNTLESPQRDVLHLASWQGLSHGAIAEQTGLPVGTVKSHLRRGVMKIRAMLEEASGAPDGARP